MAEFSSEMRATLAAAPEEARAALALRPLVWIVADARRKNDVHYFNNRYGARAPALDIHALAPAPAPAPSPPCAPSRPVRRDPVVEPVVRKLWFRRSLPSGTRALGVPVAVIRTCARIDACRLDFDLADH